MRVRRINSEKVWEEGHLVLQFDRGSDSGHSVKFSPAITMSLIFSIVLAGTLTLAQMVGPVLSHSVQALGTLPGLDGVFTGTPSALGLEESHLLSCPKSPNCVVSQGETDEDHQIAPIEYTTDRDTARELLLKVLTVVPRTEVIEQTDDYIRFQSTSRLLGFVDDGEFYFPKDEAVIQMRSASRMGESDLGVNRRRLEQIRLAMADLGA